MPDRRASRLLTLDRALLLGAIGVGSWIATNDLRRTDLETRVHAQEVLQVDTRADVVELKIDRAGLSARLDAVQEELNRLREVIERKLP